MTDLERIIAELNARIAALEAEVAELKTGNNALKAENTALRQENTELKRRLDKNSQNSSKPPSSDGLRKANRNQSLRKKGQKKSGGQKGHKGHTLKQVSEPDHVMCHHLSSCPECTHDLSQTDADGSIARQVFDIPLPKVEVTEHRAEIKQCPGCKKRVYAAFPDDVRAPVSYGQNIRGFAVYLQHQQLIPEDRLQSLFTDLFQLPLATATLTGFTDKAFNGLEAFEQAVLQQVSKAGVKHLDETGFRIGGKTQWLHVASNEALTFYHTSPKRKSLLSGLSGTVVHDHYKPYYQLGGVDHALCHAHHLRELNALVEEKESWAKKMRRWLLHSLRYKRQHQGEPIATDKLVRLGVSYMAIVQEGLAYHESLEPLPKKGGRGKAPKRKGHNLLLRLQDYSDDVLRFLTDPKVPFTNNQAEQDIRMMKCKQKVSGGFRTAKGAEKFARIRGFISTARKQGWNILESIQKVFNGAIPLPSG